jgi:UDP-glucose 4-epimerase
MRYRDKHVIVTGGLGFIGSNLSLRLIEEGARVTILDSAIPGCGANRFNLVPAGGRINVLVRDIGQAEEVPALIATANVIFNLAGEISHIRSMKDPVRDMKLNTVSQLTFLEACVRNVPGVRMVYGSTRQIYGIPRYLPIDELHPVEPIDFNGVHKAAADFYHGLFAKSGALDACVIRLSNIYGPRMAVNVPGQGFLGNFIRKALVGEPIEIFGDGNQLRDPVFVDDAVNAFLAVGAAPKLEHRVFNLGGAEVLSLKDIANTIVEVAGGSVEHKPFPNELKPINIGNFHGDSSRLKEQFHWSQQTDFRKGIKQTISYYRQHLNNYLDSRDWPRAQELLATVSTPTE